jgi:far upstream element-binding protein
VHCPKALVGRLIGKQGDTIKDLQRRSGARIQIDQNFPEGTPRVVTVEGSAQCVALGVQLVRSLIGNSPAVGNGNPGKMTTFECPKALVGRVIGKGGETINELQRRSGARIQIEQRVPEGAPCIIEARRGVRVCFAASTRVAPAASARARAAVSRDRARARPQVQGSDAAVEEARRLTHDVMGGKRLEPFAGGVAYYGPGAPPGAGYGIPPYLVPQTGGVDFAGGLAQYSRAARLENEKLATKARLRGVPRAPPRAPTRADPQADGHAPSGGVLYPPPGAYGVPPYAYAYGGGAPYAYAPYYARGGLVPGGYGGPPPPPPAQAVTPDGWTSHVDGQGRQYWHHATSGQSSWDAPPSQSP